MDFPLCKLATVRDITVWVNSILYSIIFTFSCSIVQYIANYFYAAAAAQSFVIKYETLLKNPSVKAVGVVVVPTST